MLVLNVYYIPAESEQKHSMFPLIIGTMNPVHTQPYYVESSQYLPAFEIAHLHGGLAVARPNTVRTVHYTGTASSSPPYEAERVTVATAAAAAATTTVINRRRPATQLNQTRRMNHREKPKQKRSTKSDTTKISRPGLYRSGTDGLVRAYSDSRFRCERST